MKRPWNLVNIPIYSLATYEGDKVNMNICTYVSGLSMKPKMYSIAVYYNTKTHKLLSSQKTCILQLLNQKHLPLVRKLGKQTGLKTDKNKYLHKNDLLMNWVNFPILKNLNAALLLEVAGRKKVQGDHELMWFKVLKSKTFNEEGVLMWQDLIDAKIIL